MPLPRPQRTPVRDGWSPRPETPAGKSQPKPLPRPARENSGILRCTKTLLEPSLEAGRTQAVASDVEVPKAPNAQGFFSQGLQGAKDKASFLDSAESMALLKHVIQRLHAGGTKRVSRQLQVDDGAVGSDAGGQGLLADTGPKFRMQVIAKTLRPALLPDPPLLRGRSWRDLPVNGGQAYYTMAALSQAQAIEKEGGPLLQRLPFSGSCTRPEDTQADQLL